MNGTKLFGGWLTMVLFLICTIGLSTTTMAANWWENIKINGDFRYRHEIITKEKKEIRHRHRFRARVNIEGKVSDQGKILVGISSGSSDPVSNNQTLGDAFSSKDVLIDLAYFEITPNFAPGLKAYGGKTKNLFFKPDKSELIWDSDIRPEGLTSCYNRDFDNLSIGIIASGLWIMDRSDADDSYLAGGQAILRYRFNEDKTNIAFGGSYFSFGNIKDNDLFYDDYSFGNSDHSTVDTSVSIIGYTPTDTAVDVTITEHNYYMYDYELLELFFEATHKFSNIPVTVMADYVTNNAVDSLKSAWLIGLRVGKSKKPGSWAFAYNYREVEKDAVFGLYTDSDFRGGGTNAKGHEIGASYQIMINMTLAATFFNNQIDLQASDKIDFQRWQFDLKFKF